MKLTKENAQVKEEYIHKVRGIDVVYWGMVLQFIDMKIK